MSSGSGDHSGDYKSEMKLSDGTTVKYGRNGNREWWNAPDSSGHASYVIEDGKAKMYSHYPDNDAPARGWEQDLQTGEISRIDGKK